MEFDEDRKDEREYFFDPFYFNTVNLYLLLLLLSYVIVKYDIIAYANGESPYHICHIIYSMSYDTVKNMSLTLYVFSSSASSREEIWGSDLTTALSPVTFFQLSL